MVQKLIPPHLCLRLPELVDSILGSAKKKSSQKNSGMLLNNLRTINQTTTSTLYVDNFAQNEYINGMSYLE
jgi:hypothetical protein